jgi:hypothetical protein
LKKNSKIKESAKTMGTAALSGVKLAGVEVANDILFEKLKPKIISFFGVSEETVNDPKFKEVILTVLPVLVHPLATVFEDKIPGSAYAKGYAELAITGSTKRNSAEALKFIVDLFNVMAVAGGDALSEKSFSSSKRIAKQSSGLDVDEVQAIEEAQLTSLEKELSVKVL